MNRLIAVYSVFNVQELIAQSIQSIAPWVDEIHVYDGRYEGFRCPCGKDHDNSCDSTSKLIETLSFTECPVEYLQLVAMPELEKRTKTLQGLDDKDVALIIDDDELFYGSPTPLYNFCSDEKLYLGWLNVLGIRHSLYPSMRLLRKVPGMRYVAGKNLSYEIHDDKGPLPESWSSARGIPYEADVLKNCGLVHLYGEGVMLGYRPLERDKARVEYDEYFMKAGLK